MGNFEQWFADQDFYTNMRFIHGDNLFSKDGDVYRVLPVQMTYVAFGEKHAEYAEAKQVGIALNTETINQRRYIGSQQSKIEQLEKLLDQMKHINDEQDKNLKTAFKTIQIQQKFDADSQGAIACLTKVNGQLEKKLNAVTNLLNDLKTERKDFKEFDLYDKGYRVAVDCIIQDLEKALRGECE